MSGKYQTALNALDTVESCLKIVREADARQTEEDDFENVALQCQALYCDDSIPSETRERIARIVVSFIAGIRNARNFAEKETVAHAASLFREFAPSVGGFILRAVLFFLFLIFAVAFFLASRLELALFSLVASASVVKLNAPLNALINVLRSLKRRK